MVFEQTVLTLNEINIFRHRYEQCLPFYYSLTFLLDPRRPEELHSKDCLPIIKFIPKSDLMFDEHIFKTTKPWNGNLHVVQKVFPTIKRLFTATPL